MGHGSFRVPASYVETHEQRQAILASVLGDASLSKPYKGAANARLRWNMGNKEHAAYKASFFSFIGTKLTEKENPGWGSVWHTAVTSCHPLFTKYRDALYIGNKKNITRSWVGELDEFGWAWLYGDDGSINKRCGIITIHCEGYGERVAQIYADCLNEFLGEDCAKIFKYNGGTPKKERCCVKINVKGSKKFLERVRPHMADGLEYKTCASYFSNRN